MVKEEGFQLLVLVGPTEAEIAGTAETIIETIDILLEIDGKMRYLKVS